jgi:MarR family transcriptional regulator, temperature-dependent positive regulator of motility
VSKSIEDAPKLGLEATLMFDPNKSPSHLLHRAQQVAADMHNRAFGANGLTQRQVAVLAKISQFSGVSQSELVAKTGIDRSTLAEMVARLETRGLLLREKSSTDNRAKTVKLSAIGQEAILAAIPDLEAIDQAMLAHLPANKRAILIELLTKIVLPAPSKSGKAAKQSALKSEKKPKKKKDRKKKKAAK